MLQTFATDRALGREFHLQALISVVDAVNGDGNLARMPEAKRQVALADRIVVTKSDLAGEAMTERLVEQIGALNAAPVGIAVDGEIEPSFLLDEAACAAPGIRTRWARPHPRALQLLVDFRKSLCPGRASIRRWRC